MALGDYRMMPRATFCQPQVASFGLTEQQARTRATTSRSRSSRSRPTARRTASATRSASSSSSPTPKYGELLGGHLIGPDVSELLPELTLAQKWDLTVARAGAQRAHAPDAVSEALQEAIHGLAGHMINF